MDARNADSSGSDEPATRRSLLLRLADARDSEAWRTFDQRYRSLVMRICRSSRLSALDAEDVYQSVLIGMSRVSPTFAYDPKKGRFRGYLSQIVKNAILRNAKRPNPPPTELEASDSQADEQRDLDERFETEWRLHHFKMALSAVECEFATESVAAFHRLLDGESIEGVAREFGMTPDGVRKIKERLRDRLKQKIAEQVRLEDDDDGLP